MENSVQNIPVTNKVRMQLMRILESAKFKKSPKLSLFLKYVVEETLDGKNKYLKEASVAFNVFGRDESFDAQLDPIVRVSSVRLRRALLQYYQTEGVDDEIRVELFKGSYVPHFYYSNRSDAEVSDDQVSPETSYPCVMVNVFENLCPDLEYGYFVDGITQEIISQLHKFRDIVVMARSSDALYADESGNGRISNNMLEVRYVLNGSICIDDQDVRINVELEDTVTQTITWSSVYKEELNVRNIISTQDEIAINVATQIAQPYGVIIRKELVNLDRETTENLNAYQLYLKFYQWSLSFSFDDFVNARDALERSIEIDPTFSNARAMLSLLYSAEYQLSYNSRSEERDYRDVAFEMARHAIKVDPDNVQAHYSLAIANLVKYGTKEYLDVAEEMYLAHHNNSLFIAIYGSFLAIRGEWERGLEIIEHAITLCPSHPDFYHIPFMLSYYHQGDYEEALKEARNCHMPEYFWVYLVLVPIYVDMGRNHLASEAAEKLIALYPDIGARANTEFMKWHMQSDLKEKMLNGLKQAGIEIR